MLWTKKYGCVSYQNISSFEVKLDNALCLIGGISLILSGLYLCWHKKLKRFPYGLYGWASITEGIFLFSAEFTKLYKCKFKVIYFTGIAAK